MKTLRDIAQMAIEALEECQKINAPYSVCDAASNFLEAALTASLAKSSPSREIRARVPRPVTITALRAALADHIGDVTKKGGGNLPPPLSREEFFRQALDGIPDYERGFIDGCQHQLRRCVDNAVNAMVPQRKPEGNTS